MERPKNLNQIKIDFDAAETEHAKDIEKKIQILALRNKYFKEYVDQKFRFEDYNMAEIKKDAINADLKKLDLEKMATTVLATDKNGSFNQWRVNLDFQKLTELFRDITADVLDENGLIQVKSELKNAA